MICIIALVVFAILAVFSARYRPLAAEAFDCVFRRVTLRKCTSNLDKRLKSQITGKIMRRHKAAGRFVFKYFEVFSWLFLILILLSLVQVGFSVYNYAVYGNCNGPDESGFCIFDPLGTNSHDSDVSVCSGSGPTGVLLSAPSLFDIADHPRTGSASAPVTVIEFGCFACENTATQAPAVKKIIEHYGTDIQFVYVDFPLPNHDLSNVSTAAGHCVYEQDAMTYWQYHFTIFEHQDSLTEDDLYSWAEAYGVDMDAFTTCMNDPLTMVAVNRDVDIGLASGVYGTPTFFIGGEPLVGVKPYKLLKAKIDAAVKEANN